MDTFTDSCGYLGLAIATLWSPHFTHAQMYFVTSLAQWAHEQVAGMWMSRQKLHVGFYWSSRFRHTGNLVPTVDITRAIQTIYN